VVDHQSMPLAYIGLIGFLCCWALEIQKGCVVLTSESGKSVSLRSELSGVAGRGGESVESWVETRDVECIDIDAMPLRDVDSVVVVPMDVEDMYVREACRNVHGEQLGSMKGKSGSVMRYDARASEGRGAAVSAGGGVQRSPAASLVAAVVAEASAEWLTFRRWYERTVAVARRVGFNLGPALNNARHYTHRVLVAAVRGGAASVAAAARGVISHDARCAVTRVRETDVAAGLCDDVARSRFLVPRLVREHAPRVGKGSSARGNARARVAVARAVASHVAAAGASANASRNAASYGRTVWQAHVRARRAERKERARVGRRKRATNAFGSRDGVVARMAGDKRFHRFVLRVEGKAADERILKRGRRYGVTLTFVELARIREAVGVRRDAGGLLLGMASLNTAQAAVKVVGVALEQLEDVDVLCVQESTFVTSRTQLSLPASWVAFCQPRDVAVGAGGKGGGVAIIARTGVMTWRVASNASRAYSAEAPAEWIGVCGKAVDGVSGVGVMSLYLAPAFTCGAVTESKTETLASLAAATIGLGAQSGGDVFIFGDVNMQLRAPRTRERRVHAEWERVLVGNVRVAGGEVSIVAGGVVPTRGVSAIDVVLRVRFARGDVVAAHTTTWPVTASRVCDVGNTDHRAVVVQVSMPRSVSTALAAVVTRAAAQPNFARVQADATVLAAVSSRVEQWCMERLSVLRRDGVEAAEQIGAEHVGEGEEFEMALKDWLRRETFSEEGLAMMMRGRHMPGASLFDVITKLSDIVLEVAGGKRVGSLRRAGLACGRPWDDEELRDIKRELRRAAESLRRASARARGKEAGGDGAGRSNEVVRVVMKGTLDECAARLRAVSREKRGAWRAGQFDEWVRDRGTGMHALRIWCDVAVRGARLAASAFSADELLVAWRTVVERPPPESCHPEAGAERVRAALYGDEGREWAARDWEKRVSFGVDEVERARARLPKYKAPGRDGVTNFVLARVALSSGTHVSAFGVVFACALEHAYRTPAMMDLFKHSDVVLLPKPKSANLVLGGRPISLLPTTAKLSEVLVNGRFEPKFSAQLEETVIPVEQGGFVRGRGTIDLVMACSALIESARAAGVPLVAFTLDITKAYDRMPPHVAVEEMLRRRDVFTHDEIVFVWEWLQRHRRFFRVAPDGGTVPGDEGMQVRCGAPQGGTLSPRIFLLAMVGLLRTLRETAERLGISVGGARAGMTLKIRGDEVSNLCYADDVLALAKNARDAQALLDAADVYMCDIGGMEFAPAKCEAILVGAVWPMDVPVPELRVSGQPIKLVDEIIYLGVPFRRSTAEGGGGVGGRDSKHVAVVEAKLESCSWLLAARGGVPTVLAAQQAFAWVRGSLMYGSEVVAMSAEDIEACYATAARRILQPPLWESSVRAVAFVSGAPRAAVAIAERCIRYVLRARASESEFVRAALALHVRVHGSLVYRRIVGALVAVGALADVGSARAWVRLVCEEPSGADEEQVLAWRTEGDKLAQLVAGYLEALDGMRRYSRTAALALTPVDDARPSWRFCRRTLLGCHPAVAWACQLCDGSHVARGGETAIYCTNETVRLIVREVVREAATLFKVSAASEWSQFVVTFALAWPGHVTVGKLMSMVNSRVEQVVSVLAGDSAHVAVGRAYEGDGRRWLVEGDARQRREAACAFERILTRGRERVVGLTDAEWQRRRRAGELEADGVGERDAANEVAPTVATGRWAAARWDVAALAENRTDVMCESGAAYLARASRAFGMRLNTLGIVVGSGRLPERAAPASATPIDNVAACVQRVIDELAVAPVAAAVVQPAVGAAVAVAVAQPAVGAPAVVADAQSAVGVPSALALAADAAAAPAPVVVPGALAPLQGDARAPVASVVADAVARSEPVGAQRRSARLAARGAVEARVSVPEVRPMGAGASAAAAVPVEARVAAVGRVDSAASLRRSARVAARGQGEVGAVAVSSSRAANVVVPVGAVASSSPSPSAAQRVVAVSALASDVGAAPASSSSAPTRGTAALRGAGVTVASLSFVPAVVAAAPRQSGAFGAAMVRRDDGEMRGRVTFAKPR